MYRASNLKSIKALDKELKEVKEGVGYNAVPPPAADLYLSPKKDLSWTGLPEFVDNIVTDYSKPSPTVASTSTEGSEFVLHKKPCFNCDNFSHLANDCRRRVQRETTRSQYHTYKSPSHKSGGHRPHGASMRPSYRPAGHRPHGPSMNLRRPTMNVRTQYKAPWVPTVNRNNHPVSRKFSTGRRNFPTVTRKFPTASKKFTTGSTKNHTTDMGKKGKAGSSQNNIDDKGVGSGWVIGGMGAVGIDGSGIDEVVGSDVSASGKGVKIISPIGSQANESSGNVAAELVKPGTKDAANQEVKKDVSSLRYIVLPNWAHDALLESYSSKPHDESSTQVPKGSGNLNPIASSSNPPTDQIKTLTMESPIPTISSPVPTACLKDSPEPSSEARLISKRVANQEETPSLDNILLLTNRFEDILGVTTSSDETIGVSDALQDPSWVEAMQEELLQFKIQNVWTLVDCPKGIRPIGIKWVLKNKKDERGMVVRNKARLDPAFPAKVNKVEKAMYGLHQAPRAWYGTLSKYLLKNGFQRGTIDQTLFIIRQREDFILVQVYVDDIIFGSSNPQLYKEFDALMHEKFQMCAMGELNFFLGLQVLQKKDGIFLSRDKYIGDILKKFRFLDSSALPTVADEPASHVRDVSQGEAFPTASGFIADHERATIAKSSTLPYDSAPRVTSPVADEGSMQHNISELTALCTSLQRQYSELLAKFQAQEEEIVRLKERVKVLEDKEDVAVTQSEDDAPIKGKSINEGEAAAERISTPTEPHHTPLPEADTSLLTTSSIPLPSIPTAHIPPVTQPDLTPIRQYSRRARIAQSSALPTIADEPASPVRDVSEGEACPIDSGFIADQDRATIAKSFTLPHDSAPKVTFPAANEGNDAPIKGRSINEGEAAAERISNDSKEIARVLTSIDAATVLAGGIDVPTGSEVGLTASLIVTRRKGKEVMIARYAEVARIHAEEELQGMIDSLDKSNETIAKYLQEYQDFASELPLEKRIEFIRDLVKYQDNYSKVEDFIPIGSKEETKRLKRKGLNLEQEQVKKQKSSKEAPEIETSTEEFTKEKMKEMMQLVPVEDVYVQSL
nr:retrotransposon protein, putative, Ty1-copia subclass [Tanacetum cinerariifolium]